MKLMIASTLLTGIVMAMLSLNQQKVIKAQDRMPVWVEHQPTKTVRHIAIWSK